MSRAKIVDWIALWVLVMGVWPLADPGHHADTLWSVADLALHVAAAAVLISRWKVTLQRRES